MWRAQSPEKARRPGKAWPVAGEGPRVRLGSLSPSVSAERDPTGPDLSRKRQGQP